MAGILCPREIEMGYEPITSFRRPIDAVQMERNLDIQSCRAAHPAALHVDKWVILRELGTARKRFGITDRQLVVLQAILALRKGTELRLDDPAGLVVHPSNATLSTRLNGMPISTLRRHLAHLVDAGLIGRRDSPNGKRYVRRYRDGNRDVFGFDLSPLVRRASQILAAAEDVRSEEENIARLRQTITLMRRDIAGLMEMGRMRDPGNGAWVEIEDLLTHSQRLIRRRLNASELTDVICKLEDAFEAEIMIGQTTIVSAKDLQIERHYQNSEKELPDFDYPHDDDGKTVSVKSAKVKTSGDSHLCHLDFSLDMVREACPEILCYSRDGIKDWRSLFDIARVVSPMMGISRSAWDQAVTTMGPVIASTVVASILQRLNKIKSPGGYLRSLTSKAADGTFYCKPMILALCRSET